MKLIFTITLFLAALLNTAHVSAQLEDKYDLRFSADFENSFAISPEGCSKLDCRVTIQPYITANEAQKTSRVYAEIKSPIVGKSSLGLTPTSTFDPQVETWINVFSEESLINAKIAFDAKSIKNGSEKDTKYALLYYAISWDKGKNFTKDSLVGNFPNANGEVASYALYTKNIAKNADTLVLRFTAKRSKDSSGTVAKVIIDNLKIYTSSVVLSTTEPYQIFANLHAVSHTPSELTLSKPISGKIYTAMGSEVVTITDSKCIMISTWKAGLYILKTIDNQFLKFQIKE